MSRFTGAALLVAFVGVESSLVLLINRSSEADGTPFYNSATVVLASEIFKLVLSLVGVHNLDNGWSQLKQFTVVEWLKFGVPALLYAINNNLFHIVLSGMMPAAFQVLLQLRVLWTGLMFWCLMNRKLSTIQWGALVLLTVGSSVIQLKPFDDAGVPEAAASSTYEVSSAVLTVAFMLTLLYTLISTLAGVYSELLLKQGGNMSIHLSNVPMYTWGLVFNLIAMLVQRSGDGGLFRGWGSLITWIICILQMSTGLLISNVMKRFDNIVKIICVTISSCIVYLVSLYGGKYGMSASFVIGAALVMPATLLYTKYPLPAPPVAPAAMADKDFTKARV